MKETYVDNLAQYQKSCIQDIVAQESLAACIDKYCKYFPVLGDITIIKSTNNLDGINLLEDFGDEEKIDRQLYTPFRNNNIYVINPNTIIQHGKAGIERCISFDTQTISYLYRYYIGQTKSLPKNLSCVLKLLQHQKTGVSYEPYLMENSSFSKVSTDVVFDSLVAFEKLYQPDHSDRSCKKKAKRIVKSYNKVIKKTWFEPKFLFQFVYAILLKICTIQIKNPSSLLKDKMEEVCQFMDTVLNCIMFPELILAKRYFEKGQAYTFFGKVQKHKENNIETIKNMAWDLTHLRSLEFESNFKISKKADAFISYMFTYDQRLLEVKECYELDALAVFHNAHIRIPFYSNVDEIRSYIGNYFASERVKMRSEKKDEVDLQELILRCEKELVEVVKL